MTDAESDSRAQSRSLRTLIALDGDALPADIRAYHQRTKHAPTRYALGPAFLDWTSQPNPYRRFEGAPLVELPLRDAEETPPFPGPAPTPAPLSRAALGLFCELGFGLSAWKSVEGSTWALRNNPSSGNLHPTEAYLLTNAIPDLGPRAALYHYAPEYHLLEERARYEADALPEGGFLLGLSAIAWRESWKYGERAYRYCQLDAGHAIGAAAQAAAALGWRAEVLTEPSDDEVAALIGLDRADAWRRREEEHPDALLWISTSENSQTPDLSSLLAAPRQWSGKANQVSDDHDGWPVVDQAPRLCRKPRMSPPSPPAAHPARQAPYASQIGEVVRKRRSAQKMDGVAILSRENFRAMLMATLPGAEPLLAAFSWRPALSLLLYVHRVERVEPGLYLLPRDEDVAARLRAAAAPDLAWTPVDLNGFEIFLLRSGSFEREAAQMACLQPIAGKGCFAVAMIADFDRALVEEGGFAYRRLHWEAGLIGQALYLWATAAGLSGTGIGCFFDDEVHRLIGLSPDGDLFQDIYHFTVGGPLEDVRIATLPAYPPELRERA
ncbi:SagB/ThcOx family dehydrogenase [Methylocystis sp. 9N]|uniref:SagB/ThcOx family dehydrogenase n=1 Tax=Methylocystis borbori TaxID=3118750 RepID=A0ABU7XCF2_9HYPH